MFKSINEARNFLFNSGLLDFINLDDENEIVEKLFRNAADEREANEIICAFC